MIGGDVEHDRAEDDAAFLVGDVVAAVDLCVTIFRRADSLTGAPFSSSTPQNAELPVTGSAMTSRRVTTFVAVCHNPSPGRFAPPFSVNFTFAASGSEDTSCLVTAARKRSTKRVRHTRSQSGAAAGL